MPFTLQVGPENPWSYRLKPSAMGWSVTAALKPWFRAPMRFLPGAISENIHKELQFIALFIRLL